MMHKRPTVQMEYVSFTSIFKKILKNVLDFVSTI